MEETPKPIAQSSPDKASGRSIASLVLGILSLVLGCVPGLDLILGVLAVTFGGLELKSIGAKLTSDKGKGFAITGLVTGILGLAWGLVHLLLVFIYGIAFLSALRK
jgi:hypothetical protein